MKKRSEKEFRESVIRVSKVLRRGIKLSQDEGWRYAIRWLKKKG